MLSEVFNYILDIGILVVLLKFILTFECSSKDKVHQESRMKINTHNSYPNISDLRCNGFAVKLVVGIVGLWTVFSSGINNTRSGSLAAVFFFVLISALCDILEFVRIIPERNRIGNFVISLIYFFIGIFLFHSYEEQMPMYSLSMCMAFVSFYCALLVVIEFDISLPRQFVDIFPWLFIIGFLCMLFLLEINYKIPYYKSIALIFIKISVMIYFILLNVYLECESDISTKSKEDFFNVVLIVDDVSQTNNNNSVNEGELACTTNKQSGGSSFSEKLSHTEEQGDGLQMKQTAINMMDPRMPYQ